MITLMKIPLLSFCVILTTIFIDPFDCFWEYLGMLDYAVENSVKKKSSPPLIPKHRAVKRRVAPDSPKITPKPDMEVAVYQTVDLVNVSEEWSDDLPVLSMEEINNATILKELPQNATSSVVPGDREGWPAAQPLNRTISQRQKDAIEEFASFFVTCVVLVLIVSFVHLMIRLRLRKRNSLFGVMKVPADGRYRGGGVQDVENFIWSMIDQTLLFANNWDHDAFSVTAELKQELDGSLHRIIALLENESLRLRHFQGLDTQIGQETQRRDDVPEQCVAPLVT